MTGSILPAWQPTWLSSKLLSLLILASGCIVAMQRVKVHLTSNQPDELKTIFSEAIDEAFHEMRKVKASAL